MKYLCGIVLFAALLALSVRPSEEACGYEVKSESQNGNRRIFRN